MAYLMLLHILITPLHSAVAENFSESTSKQQNIHQQALADQPKIPFAPSTTSLSLGSRPTSWGELPPRQELKYLGLFSSKATLSNVTATGLFDDQLVGRLYGDNGSTTQTEAVPIFESRALAFFDYQPQSVNGRARFKVGFEVDFTFGDSANTPGSNSGGAINGDQVNLQTKRLLMELDLMSQLTLVVGLQPLADSAYNPTSADPYDLLLGGGRLMFWGTDAAGLSLFGRFGEHVARASFFTLNVNKASESDDISLAMLDMQFQLPMLASVGLHTWYLQDASMDQAGGLESNLPHYTGATTLNLTPDTALAKIMWIGTDLSHNRGRRGGPLSVDLALFMNLGNFSPRPGTCRETNRCPQQTGRELAPFDPQEASLLAFFGDLQLGYRYGNGDGDAFTLGYIYATGDNQPDDRILSSVVTGNAFGTPGALFAHHRALLLFPDPRSINRHVGVVYDPGNLGYGLSALSLAGSMDVLPETLNAKIGFISAHSAALPSDTLDRFIGAELNAELIYRPAPFLWLGFHTGMARLGRFLESSARVPTSPIPSDHRPWSTSLSITWIQL